MANARISELIQRTPDGTEFLEVIIPPFTPGTNRRVLLQDILDMAGAVDSVNGQTGVVVLDAGDVGADPAGSAAAAAAASQPIDADLTAIAGLSPSNDDVLQRKAGAWVNRTVAQYKADLLNTIVWTLEIPYTDETSPITAVANKKTFWWPYDNCTIVGVTVALATVQTSGSIFTVDVNKNGTTILSTKITVDNTESTSATAATPPVISVSSATKLDKFTVDQDQIGDNTAKGATLIVDYTRVF